MLALRIGPLEEMISNIDDVSSPSREAFLIKARAIFSQGAHVTPALHAEVLQGGQLWGSFRPTVPSKANNFDLLLQLSQLPESSELVLVLPSDEFLSNTSSEPIVVDSLSADVFAPSVASNLAGQSMVRRVQVETLPPPFFIAEESDKTKYTVFPRGAPFVARRDHLSAFVLSHLDDPFRAWAFGVFMYEQHRTLATLAQVGSTYIPKCDAERHDEVGKIMVISANCKLANNLTSDPTANMPIDSPVCNNQAIWQETCLDGEPI
ncbi:MAG: hypothetical protein SGPRY_003304 [Prymnesium sp.]